MKKLLTLALAIGLMSFASLANAVTPLTIFVEADGTAVLTNTTADAIQFDSYQITSASGDLDVDGWRSIGDAVAADAVAVIGSLGAGALAFGEANPGASQLAELNLAGSASLPGGGTFSLGKPFTGGQGTDAAAKFGIIGVGPTEPVDIVAVPEPATVVMAAMALLGLVGYIRRR